MLYKDSIARLKENILNSITFIIFLSQLKILAYSIWFIQFNTSDINSVNFFEYSKYNK